MQDRGKPRSDKADWIIAGAEGKKLAPRGHYRAQHIAILMKYSFLFWRVYTFKG